MVYKGRYKAETPEEAERFRERVEALRQAHGLKKKDLYGVMKMSRQNYHRNFHKAKSFSQDTVEGICELFGITSYMLMQSDDVLFYRLHIFALVRDYHHAKESYESVKLGPWYADPLPEIMNIDHIWEGDKINDQEQ